MSDSPANTPSSVPPVFGQAHFARLSAVLERFYGLAFDPTKQQALRIAVDERLREMATPAAYDAYIDLVAQADPRVIVSGPVSIGTLTAAQSPATAELRTLIDRITVNETSFFRNRDHFAALRAEVLPRLIRRHVTAEDRQLRLWSAGCAGGQEAYGLAITVLEALADAGQAPEAWDVSIFATDISSRALHAAAAGRYRHQDLRGLSEAQIVTYLRPVMPAPVPSARATFQVAQVLRRLVHVTYFNLAQAIYPANTFGNLDLIFCENVTIYLTPDATRRVIDNLYTMLSEGGFLFIGYSETLWQISDKFRLVGSNDTFYYQKPFRNDPKPVNHGRYRPMTGPIPSAIAAPDAPPAPRPPPGRLNLRRITPQPAPRPTPARLDNSAELIRTARAAIVAGDFDMAGAQLERVLTYEPNNTDALCVLARRALALAQIADAIRYCQAAIGANPLCEEAYILLGMIYRQQDDNLSSIRAFQNALYINFDSIIPHLYLGQMYEKLQDRPQALREYKGALAALRQQPPDAVIEEWPAELLRHTCEQNIRRLTATGIRRA